MKVLAIGRHVSGQLRDSFGKQGDLNLGGTRIALLGLIAGDNFRLPGLIQVLPLKSLSLLLFTRQL